MKTARWIKISIGLGSALAIANGAFAADALTPLQVAYAGSMGSMMDGGVKPAVAKSLVAEMHARRETLRP